VQAFTKNPATWLNADAWGNEPEPVRESKTRRDESRERAEENARRLKELKALRGHDAEN
jgi:hypothetical protein